MAAELSTGALVILNAEGHQYINVGYYQVLKRLIVKLILFNCGDSD